MHTASINTQRTKHINLEQNSEHGTQTENITQKQNKNMTHNIEPERRKYSTEEHNH